MTYLRRSLVALFTLLLGSILAQAQISYSGGTYTQNFDTLPNTGTFTFTGVGPHAAPSLPGWSFAKISGSGANALFNIGTGSGTTGSVYSFGAASATDRAYGTLFSGTVGSVIGAVFTNNTGATITQFTLSYTGKQWRYGGSLGTDRLIFEYQLGGSAVNAGVFTAAASLDFVSPVHGNGVTAGTATVLNGNDPANQLAISATITGLSWTAGQSLVLRWRDFDVAPGADDGLSIDDLSFSTSGEPPAAVPPTVTATVPADDAINVSPATSIAITFNAAATVSGSWFTIDGSTSGNHTATVMGGPTTYTLVPAPAFAEGETVTVNVIGALVKDAITNTAPMAADYPFAFNVQSLAPLPIHTIQGSGTASAYAGQAVSVEGIVTADFQGSPGLGGFYLQAAEADYDVDPNTSEGIFVFNTTFPVSVGQVVRVYGTVAEFGTAPKTQTELTTVTAVVVLGTAGLPAPVNVTLPFATATSAEAYEGMRATLPQTLTVTDTFDLGHFGEVFLSNGRLPTPTNVVAPGAPAIAQAAANLRNMIMLDDAISTTFPDPTPYLADSAGRGLTRRSGSTATGVTGILDEKFGSYIIEPTAAVTFVDANPRSDPPAVGGTLKVAIGNVLNLFNGNGSGGGFPTSRGADTQAEFVRQRAKIIAGITALAPDIMGLTEIENDGYGPTSALADLVNGLNAAAPAGTTYAYVNASVADIVTDEIHCAFIYRTQTVATVGDPKMLSDPAFNSVARNPLAQTFQQLSNGEKLTVSINHFKSKGSAASYPSTTANADKNDGQGRSNFVRVLQANALADWLAGDPTGSGDPDFLIIGDLNAYAKEDPIVALETKGYINLTEASEGDGGYSYAFDAAFGHLDHALANDHLAGQVVSAATWHVNSDEPVFLDYNILVSEFSYTKTAAQQAVNVGTSYRYSDHDPVVVGLNLQPDPAIDVTSSLQITRGSLALNRKTGRFGQTVTIKNTSAQAIAAPLSFVLTQLSANGTAYAPTGYTAVVPPLGSPYYNVNVGADNLLTPNETVTVFIEYTNSNNQPITYVHKVLAGPGR